MKSRKQTLANLKPLIKEWKGFSVVDVWGDIDCYGDGWRAIIFTRGKGRSPSSIQLYTTIHCREDERLSKAFRLAKQMVKTLNFPVTFSAAGRMIVKTINP
jgi:hypothetical protein